MTITIFTIHMNLESNSLHSVIYSVSSNQPKLQVTKKSAQRSLDEIYLKKPRIANIDNQLIFINLMTRFQLYEKLNRDSAGAA